MDMTGNNRNQHQHREASILNRLVRLFRRRDPWEYGILGTLPARRHRKTGECQFVLWKAGEQGHREDCWHPFGAGHARNFKPNNKIDDSREAHSSQAAIEQGLPADSVEASECSKQTNANT